ncbi:MAG: D-aminoacyl-tRNA deacylase, partial [archaeon]|nr:D-aminoacyl-tRNA deacylase [archaeon]
MKFIIQKVLEASVTVDNEIVGQIGKGFMILVGLSIDDTEEYIEFVTDKFLNLRLFDDDKGTRWKESIKSLGLELLLVSQFTLHSVLKGNKPDFHFAMENEKAKAMFDKMIECLKKKYDPNKIKTGKFGEYMKVSLVNDGPCTIEWEYPGEKAMKIEQNNKKREEQKENKNKKNKEKKEEK